MRGRVLLCGLAGLSVARAAVACDPEVAPAAIDRPALEWLALAPATLRASIEREGIAFPSVRLPSSALGRLCPDMTPAIVVFEDPPEVVFDLLIQTDRQNEFMSSLGAIRSVSRAPLDHVDRHDIRILFTHLTYHVRHRWSFARKRIWWDLSTDHPNDLRQVSGYWELHSYGPRRTLGFYGTSIDVGPVIPKRLQTSLTARSMRSAVTNLRRWVIEQRGVAP